MMAAIELMGLAMGTEWDHGQWKTAGPTESEGLAELKILALGSLVLQIGETLHHLWVADLP